MVYTFEFELQTTTTAHNPQSETIEENTLDFR